jgi:hypothetical protein
MDTQEAAIQREFIWTASIKSAIRYHEELAGRSEKRVSSSATPNSAYCLELKALAGLHRAAAELFKTAKYPAKFNQATGAGAKKDG